MAYRFRSGLGFTLQDLGNAIARQEGACSGGSCRNNNPGNLTAGPGMIGTDSRGIAIFPDLSTGWSALYNQEQLNINRGLSLSQFFGGVPGGYPGYAPAAAGNNPTTYTSNVAGWLGGIDPNAPLSTLVDSGSGASTNPPVSDDSGSVPPLDSSDNTLSTSSWLTLGVLAAGLALMVTS